MNKAEFANLTVEDRTALARMLINMLDDWGVEGGDQVKILALPEGTRPRALKRYRDNTPLPDDKEVLLRAEFLLAIAEALRTAYPVNPRMGARWLNQRHRRFRSRTPLATILEDGMSGLVSVRAELDCTYSWDQTGSKR